MRASVSKVPTVLLYPCMGLMGNYTREVHCELYLPAPWEALSSNAQIARAIPLRRTGLYIRRPPFPGLNMEYVCEGLPVPSLD